MTPEQFDRWKDFSLRMARTCFAEMTDPDTDWIVQEVADFLDGIDEDEIPCIRDWDHSNPYPEGSRWYRRSEHPCWTCKGSGQQPTKTGRPRRKPQRCTTCKGTGTRYEYARPSGVGDIAADWENEHVYHRFHCLATDEDDLHLDMVRQFEEHATDGTYRDQDDGDEEAEPHLQKPLAGHTYAFLAFNPPVLLPLDTEEWRTTWCDRYADPVKACLRAGLDIASSPSAGVCGFTAGNIRAMYPDGIPEWVAAFFTDREIVAVAGVIPGVGIRFSDRREPAPAFNSLPDDMPIWL